MLRRIREEILTVALRGNAYRLVQIALLDPLANRVLEGALRFPVHRGFPVEPAFYAETGDRLSEAWAMLRLADVLRFYRGELTHARSMYQQVHAVGAACHTFASSPSNGSEGR